MLNFYSTTFFSLARPRLAVLAIMMTVLLSACAGTATNTDDPTANWPAEQLYEESKTALEIGDYETAIDYLEKLESRFPFGRYAQQAQLEIAYAYYKYDEPESAISAADRFIKLHPRHQNVDYAYYLKGLASFVPENNFIENWMDKDPSQLDPAEARRSFGFFATLIKKFPNSKYTADAKKRMSYLRDNLARHEVNVARFYLRKGANIAAANRAKYILENYQQTPSVNQALEILKEAYSKLNMQDLASDTDRVIKLNKSEPATGVTNPPSE